MTLQRGYTLSPDKIMDSHGIDIVEVPRIEKAIARWGERFLRRVYTARELRYCQGRPLRLAARFAAKEAVSKALGTGIGKIAWKDIEVVPSRSGIPRLRLYGRARARAMKLRLNHFLVSLSHSRHFAVASVVGRSE